MIIVDTNVLSELMRPRPSPEIVHWFNLQRERELWTTSITALELIEGVLIMAEGRAKARLNAVIDVVLRVDFRERMLPFDMAAAESAASIAANRRRQGRPIEIRDTQIAGITQSRGASLATRNIRHFSDLSLEVINPWHLET